MGTLVGWAPGAGQTGAAFVVRSLQNPADGHEARPEVLDTPILPGSVIKVVTLVAALEYRVITSETARMCRRTATVDGRKYVCSHPDLKRPLTAAEALAYSCNDFFVSLAPALSRSMVNQVRVRLGLPQVSDSANLAASLIGLDGPRITPRALLDVVSRLVGADAQRTVTISETARRVLLEGLRGAANYGSAQALNVRKVPVLAKTGTAPMPGGSWMGLVVALEPADKPTRGIVVVAPGAAGLDAAAIAADLLQRDLRSGGSPDPPKAGLRTIQIGLAGASGSQDPPLRTISLDLEEYIARVVAAEGEPAAPDAAQQALAITARTFALANLQRHRREGYDLCDTTHCQVLRAPTAASRRAAEATAGRVLLYQEKPASVFYSASCGGYSELASAVWPGALNHGMRSQRDDACRSEPAWESSLRADEIQRALRAAGHRGDRLRDLQVIDRTTSNRVARLRLDGFTPNEITGHDFRMAVGRTAGWQSLKSTAFEVRRTGNGYQFTGRGFGHGVGLCVIGAGQRARQGTSADEILAFYFPTLRVGTIPGASTLTSARPMPSPPSLPAPLPVAVDVLVGLPGADEVSRGLILQLVRSARDAIVAKTAVPQPSSIRVTAHPTVEAFARATGQPWWVSGATDGDGVDLLPISILRQRGQLERTIRHEVAHVLLDGPLANRPLWVREGAATYFGDLDAQASGSAESTSRLTCPEDAEFLRPQSAGTHRTAYARAEACFRRQIDRGTKWQDVGRR
jgi:stage II sporulation protein D